MRKPSSSRPGTLLGASLAAGLAAFHLLLFWNRLWAGAFLRPAVGLRWTLGALALLGLLRLRRHRVPLLQGRQAIGLWTFVLLLHWSAAAEPAGAAAVPAELLAPLPVTLTLATGLLAIGVARPLAAARPALRPVGACGPWVERPRAADVLLPSLPRPPPAAAF